MSVLINADDFGKDEEVNRAICEAFEKGYVGHTTLMVNMPGAKEAFLLAKEKGFCDKVGLHLNITEGLPISDDIRNNPLICGTDGSFNAAFYHNMKYRLYMDSLSIQQIEKEFAAQIERFLELGFTQLHIDSHHHVHTNYPVYLALKRLGRRYRFSYVRLSRNLYHGGNPLNRIYKGFYNRSVKRLCERTSDLFGSYQDLIDYTGGDAMRCRKLSAENSIEVMAHPLYVNGVLTDTDIPMTEYEKLTDRNLVG